MKAPSLQTASQEALPPPPDLLLDIDPMERERTRFSEGRTHRYTLFRRWGDPENYVAFVGMNPSGADEIATDRTVAKCRRFAMKWEWNGRRFGSLYMLNSFGLRATDPKELWQAPDPVGPDNDRWIREVAGGARLVIAAWGKDGADLGRGERLKALLSEVCAPENVLCFGFNLDGSPKHPLYQKESLTPADLARFLR